MPLSLVKRQQIINAAIIEFREQGFQACSMDAITERAQVSKRTVYNHFSSKEELFLSILNQLIENNANKGSTQYIPGLPIKEQLLLVAQKEIEILQSDEIQQFSRILSGELVRSEKLARMFDKQRPSCQDTFMLWLSSACHDGVLRIEDMQLAADQFFGLLKALAFWPTLFRQKILTSEEKTIAATSTVDMFLCSYQVKETLIKS